MGAEPDTTVPPAQPAAAAGSWPLATHHRDIGNHQLLFALLMFLLGGGLALLMRLELLLPGLQFIRPALFNQLFTLHGLIMVFGAALPALMGLASWMLPSMIGARRMALPRLHSLSFWLLPAAFALLLLSLLLPGGGPASGGALTPPLSLQQPLATTLAALSLLVMSAAFLLAAVNLLLTLLIERSPDMSLAGLPLFAWSLLITSLLLLAVLPVLIAALLLLLAELHLGTRFFSAGGGGDPMLYQHLFWFFGQPGLHILLLPAFGLLCEVLPVYARKPLFGRQAVMLSMLAIGVLSLMTWGHKLLSAGLPLGGSLFFMYSSMGISVALGLLVCNWLATLWRGAMSFETPMLFALAFLGLFLIGALAGLMLAVAPTSSLYHNSYFVVAQLHYLLVSGTLFAIFAAVYHWLPQQLGPIVNEGLGRLHFWSSLITVNLVFFPQFYLGLAGMPRRVADYPAQFSELNFLSSLGALGFGLAQLPFVLLIWQGLRARKTGPGRTASA